MILLNGGKLKKNDVEYSEGTSMDYRDKIRLLCELYDSGVIERLEKHEMYPELDKGSKENYLYFTFASAFDTYQDPETRFVFDPASVLATDTEAFTAAMLKHKFALQRNKHPLIIRKLSEGLMEHYDGDPRKFLEESNYSIKDTIANLKEKKKVFPYLSGIKLSNYWLFILSRFTDAQFTDPHELSIIPDTHIIKSTVQLGLLEGNPTSEEVEAVWRDILVETGVAPGKMHSILWLWSRNKFSPEV
jgi:hypothetical protein